MSCSTAGRLVLGPAYDFRRFVVGQTSSPPPTRRRAEADVRAARVVLTAAGCDLSRCQVSNLHAQTVALPAGRLYDLFLAWDAWPCSAFFACPSVDADGGSWLRYRFYKTLPIVVMRLKTAVRPYFIIYDLVWGIGAGGYHAFLFRPVSAAETEASILTTFPPSRLFFEGLHDQMNLDVYRAVEAVAARTRQGDSVVWTSQA